MLFNKPCMEDDWNNEAFQKILIENLQLPRDCLIKRERKHWEWAMGFLALEYYGYLNRGISALGMACGHESFLYALTNYVNHVTATDLYGETPFSAGEANINVLQHPESFCNFPYEKDRLAIKRMDARELKFPDASFDVLFSFSSVEHFGSCSQIKQAMLESYRVLKPGGIYVLSVDYLFRTPWPILPRFLRIRESGESLTESEIFHSLIESTGFSLRQPIAYTVDEKSISNIYNFQTGQTSTGNLHPHIYIMFRRFALRPHLFTSLFLTLFKN